MWTIFVYCDPGHYSCCGGLDWEIFIYNSSYDEALELFAEEFNVDIDSIRSQFYCLTGENLEEIWYDSAASERFGPFNFEEIRTSNRVRIYQNSSKGKRIIMPNGVDGLNCFKCKNWYPYVEENYITKNSEHVYICRDCKSIEEDYRDTLIPKSNDSGHLTS